MSRDKKPGKARNKKYADPKTGAFRHTDGDRRHRLGATAKDAIKHKKRMQELGGLPPEGDENEGEVSEPNEPAA
jgi:hypothetical protein